MAAYQTDTATATIISLIWWIKMPQCGAEYRLCSVAGPIHELHNWFPNLDLLPHEWHITLKAPPRCFLFG